MDWLRRIRQSIDHGGKPEDPQRVADALLRDLADQLSAAEAALANQLATVADLRERARQANELAAKRKVQAVAAMNEGQEDLARKALAERLACEQRAREAERLADEAEDVSRQLHSHIEALRLEQLKLQAERDGLVARGGVAVLDRKLADVKSGLDARARSFEALADRTARLEAEAAAHREVAERAWTAAQTPSAPPDAGEAPRWSRGTTPTQAPSAEPGTPGHPASGQDLDAQLEALRRQLGKETDA
ncbi:PspA/IM30 family protein [Alicyclobacillus cycloheptanicus]|uniref:Phage shock protein A n=1 Tax=Alicyclobacillus cycloheptanicus TaxID=1457 RepID=A0ABT9XD72_9BACL|nr:PspA/IM30 family protein [Alicyclobacillus cycloheptanicus]MDQ0188233.1 phage shock protein A [Alicyclobacillus cycloheptanicus]WDM00961.1 PspA/IM30 family protein [Alicyclobacillus cycloheptanicus]